MRQEFALRLSCLTLQSSILAVVVAEGETIQHLCWCFGTELDMMLQSRSVADDRAAEEASVVAHLSNLVLIASSRHEEELGAVRCTFRIAFDCDNRGLSGRDVDIQSRGAVSCRTLYDHSMVVM